MLTLLTGSPVSTKKRSPRSSSHILPWAVHAPGQPCRLTAPPGLQEVTQPLAVAVQLISTRALRSFKGVRHGNKGNQSSDQGGSTGAPDRPFPAQAPPPPAPAFISTSPHRPGLLLHTLPHLCQQQLQSRCFGQNPRWPSTHSTQARRQKTLSALPSKCTQSLTTPHPSTATILLRLPLNLERLLQEPPSWCPCFAACAPLLPILTTATGMLLNQSDLLSSI